MNDFFEQIKNSGDQQAIDSIEQMMQNDPNKPALIVNTDQPVLEKLQKLGKEQASELTNYFLKLAKLGQGSLKGQEFIDFLELSAKYAFESNETNPE